MAGKSRQKLFGKKSLTKIILCTELWEMSKNAFDHSAFEPQGIEQELNSLYCEKFKTKSFLQFCLVSTIFRT